MRLEDKFQFDEQLGKLEFVGMKKVGGYKCITAYLFASSTMDFNKDFTKSCWMSSNGVMNE